MKSTCFLVMLALASAMPVGSVQAQYPERPITMIVPFAPGGGSDTLSRLIAQKVAEQQGVSLVVENRPGGNTTIGARYVARAKPDGYTVLTAIDATMLFNPVLYKELSYEPSRDFEPVAMATFMPLVLSVAPGSSIQTVGQWIDSLKKGQTDYSMYAHGAMPGRIAMEVITRSAGITLTPVPFNGSTPALQAVLGGHVPVLIDALAPSLPHLEADKLRPLMVTTQERTPILPDVPAAGETGFLGVDLASWTGFFIPAGTDPAQRQWLEDAFVQALSDPDLASKLRQLGMDVTIKRGVEFQQQIDRDSARYKQVITDAGLAGTL
ncbi:tripartite tricarboxylate transporter substrate binding protein [Alcaligenes faecalis]|uniref:Bug family tripartite tricarboxylate transporter substrate binding protein n=1 Tax=Alcaligenes faecalis TaxID=511 RepID=UPI0018D078AB|nr:tripartite tricarboxylate transporter substrate binding protein [Alcaligenes faecalis]MBH0308745.1 tripartite tricarboxylate transporter substrate binding protein [Alcaligenes faecalis]